MRKAVEIREHWLSCPRCGWKAVEPLLTDQQVKGMGPFCKDCWRKEGVQMPFHVRVRVTRLS